jgi:hypothetical protein
MDNFNMTDSLRAKAAAKPNLNILFVTDNDSRSSIFRGESMIKSFVRFYDRTCDISYQIAPSSKLAKLGDSELAQFNVVWLDNISDYMAAVNFGNVIDRLTTTINPDWKTTATRLATEDKDTADKFLSDLIAKRKDTVRIIYALDEFVWEAPLGRSKELKRVQVIETLMDMSDTVVVPSNEMADLIQGVFKFTREDMDISVIPSSISPDFLPLYKNFMRMGDAGGGIRKKPRVLIKGVMIPENVQEFIMENFKKMDITVCSVGEVNEHVLGLLHGKKVNHIMHWSHPHVNKRNMLDTLAIERDSGFDIVIHTMPKIIMKSGDGDAVKQHNFNELAEKGYDISIGDEDILFSIAYGAIPVCESERLDYAPDHISKVSGYEFGIDTPAKYLRSVVTSLCDVPVKFNEVYAKCKAAIEQRVASNPSVMGSYFATMVGPELMEARRILMEEAKAKVNSDTHIDSDLSFKSKETI